MDGALGTYHEIENSSSTTIVLEASILTCSYNVQHMSMFCGLHVCDHPVRLLSLP
jgi:hypothetical protein